MKNIVVIVALQSLMVLVQGAVPDAYVEIYTPLVEECQECSPFANSQDVQDVLDLKPDISEAAQCLAACADIKYGLIKDGKYGLYDDTVDLIYKVIEGEDDAMNKAEKIAEECFQYASEEKPDLCEAADWVLQCTLNLL